MMTCRKCENSITTGTKCFQCGYDASREQPQNFLHKSKYYRSRPLTVFMCLNIAIHIIMILLSVFLLSVDNLLVQILAVILIAESVFGIVLCVFILRLKKWAFNIYIGLSIVNAVIRLLSFDVFTVAIRGLLLYLVFKNDYKYFD